ncbi:MAG: TlpA family protein disulfide reductase, partial [Cyclobacteriaceae bacterium]|nr:TlpA family protein disulfide reductase [Cyclobacteriaceae bacterium]
QKGELVNLSQFKGKVVFLNLWASWCAPCKAEMPGIDELYLDLKNEKDIVFVMLSIDRNEQAAKRYMDKQAYAFPYYQWSGSLTSQLTVSSIPTTYVVSKEGKILKKEVGMARYNTNAFKKFLLKEANGE